MADWQRKLEIADLHNGYRAGTVSVSDLASGVADRLAKLSAFNNEDLDTERDEIVEEFRCLSKENDPNIDDYDEVLERLYNWADTPLSNDWNPQKVCWVATF